LLHLVGLLSSMLTMHGHRNLKEALLSRLWPLNPAVQFGLLWRFCERIPFVFCLTHWRLWLSLFLPRRRERPCSTDSWESRRSYSDVSPSSFVKVIGHADRGAHLCEASICSFQCGLVVSRTVKSPECQADVVDLSAVEVKTGIRHLADLKSCSWGDYCVDCYPVHLYYHSVQFRVSLSYYYYYYYYYVSNC